MGRYAIADSTLVGIVCNIHILAGQEREERRHGTIAFLLSAEGGAAFYGASRESNLHAPPALVVKYCR